MSDSVFDNRFCRELPGKTNASLRPHQVHGAAWSAVRPSPVGAPRLLAWSDELGESLGLDRPASDEDAWVQALAGNRLLPGMQGYAMCYGGHQFGHWAGQLGDGRVVNLGELVTPSGQRQELQLKGAGLTPYSRGADGRAVLRSSLREFLCSEAMHHLGVPTTRALSLVSTGESVVRDMFYDGRPESEPGAITCRVAPSFLRFGSYELPARRGDGGLLRALVDYSVREHAPAFWQEQADIAGWFRDICQRTARLLVHWQRVGFVHGVMNTDNMSILGLTIDYGPYGWLEPYDPRWTPNTTDADGRRYCFGRQPIIAQWNLACLGEALATLLDDIEPLKQALNEYAEVYAHEHAAAFAAKLGLRRLDPQDALLDELLNCLQRLETDYCISFRCLARMPFVSDPQAQPQPADVDLLAPAFYAEPSAQDREAWLAWLQQYHARLQCDGLPVEDRRPTMDAVNPKYVLRNYLAQQAIEAAQLGDTRELETLQRVLRHPYAEQPEYERYAGRRPDWARDKPGCSALSCSS